MTSSIWWVRRDLRLSDNEALTAAASDSKRVIPVYVMDHEPKGSRQINVKQQAFLLGGLRRLDATLREFGSGLIVRQGEPAHVLAALLAETGAHTIFAEQANAPETREQDARLAARLPLYLKGGAMSQRPDTLHGSGGTPFAFFTPFAKAWRARPLPKAREVLRAPSRLSSVADIDSLPIPQDPALSSAVPFPPGEAEAQRRLRAFFDPKVDGSRVLVPPVYQYEEARNRLDTRGTSQLSPYLRFGMLSARQAVVSALSALDGAPDTEARYSAGLWLEQLIRRDFFMYILYHYPQVRQLGFRREFQSVAWQRDQASFAAWSRGETGYPLVDAAIRQLLQSGWIPNQARRVAASFLVKDLLVDWRWGEHFFLEHLVDGDEASNSGGWQEVAGVGTGPAPYLGILNPVLQGLRYDPNGDYVRRWLPELARVPNQYVHQPWRMPQEVQREAGCMINRDYPTPITDHALARDRAIQFFTHAREPVTGSAVTRN